MGDEAGVLAEREYQRRLAALHATRAELAAVDAALRRLAIDRSRLGSVADDRARELEQRRAVLRDRARDERAEAQAQRELLQHYRGSIGAEPAELPPEAPPTGPPIDFVQPPFGEQR